MGRLHHVGIATNDLAGALAFYGAVLGMKVTSDETRPSHGVRAVFLAGESDEGGEIELLLPLGGESPIARFLARRGPGMHHVALEVPDIAAAIAA